MQIACLLVLLWCTAWDPRARIELQPPSDSVLVMRAEGNGAGESGWAELSQASLMGPHITGAPKERQRLRGNGRHCPVHGTGGPADTGPQTFPGFHSVPGRRGKPNNSSSGPGLFLRK